LSFHDEIPFLEVEAESETSRRMGEAILVKGGEDFRPHIQAIIEVRLEARSHEWPRFHVLSGGRRDSGGRAEAGVIDGRLRLFNKRCQVDTCRDVRMRENIFEELVGHGAGESRGLNEPAVVSHWENLRESGFGIVERPLGRPHQTCLGLEVL